jgi:hypothetical protein
MSNAKDVMEEIITEQSDAILAELQRLADRAEAQRLTMPLDVYWRDVLRAATGLDARKSSIDALRECPFVTRYRYTVDKQCDFVEIDISLRIIDGKSLHSQRLFLRVNSRNQIMLGSNYETELEIRPNKEARLSIPVLHLLVLIRSFGCAPECGLAPFKIRVGK